MTGEQRSQDGGDAALARPLARAAHLFASAVCDVLETRLLAEAAASPLAPRHLHVLTLVSFEGEHPVGQVAEFLGVSVAAASKSVNALVRLGLLSRSTRASDRRVASLAITERGRRALAGCHARERALVERVIAAIGADEARGLAPLLSRVSLALLAEGGGGSGRGRRSCLRCGAHFEADCAVAALLGSCPYLRARPDGGGGEGRG